MELALEVALRCRVDAATVWAAWGMLKLRMRQFPLAREKLKHFFGARAVQMQSVGPVGVCVCFFFGGGALAGWIFSGPTAPQSTQTRTDSTVSPAVARSHTRCRWPPASTGDAANRAKVLADVVLTLETSRSNDLVRLRELYGKLTEYYQGNGRRGAAMEGSESSDERDLYGLRRCHRLRSVAAAVPRKGGGPADATFLGRFIAATYVRCLCALAASSKSTARSPQPSTSASTTCRRSTGTGSTSAYIRLSRGRGRAHGQGDGADEEGGSGCFARR